MALVIARILAFASAAYGVAAWQSGCFCILEDDQGARHLLGAEVNESDLELEGCTFHICIWFFRLLLLTHSMLLVTSFDYSGKVVHLLVSAIESLLAGWFPSLKYERFIKLGDGESSVDELLSTLMNIKVCNVLFPAIRFF
jgi:hypothetical protein